VGDALSGAGYRLSFAEDVPSALAVLRSEPVDVVVADHVMPGLSGLAVSAINQASVFRFIEKPFDPIAVRLAIRCAVDDLERERDRDRRATVVGEWVRREACSA
jgi:DNA-binding NtrC family response regulator